MNETSKITTPRETEHTKEFIVHQSDAARSYIIRVTMWKKIEQIYVSLEEWKNEQGSRSKNQSFVLKGDELAQFKKFLNQEVTE